MVCIRIITGSKAVLDSYMVLLDTGSADKVGQKYKFLIILKTNKKCRAYTSDS